MEQRQLKWRGSSESSREDRQIVVWSASVIWHLSFPSFTRFYGFLSLQRLETGKPGNSHINPNLCIQSLLTSYDMVKYNLIPSDKLMGVMVDIMVDKKGVICVQRGVVIEVLWDA